MSFKPIIAFFSLCFLYGTSYAVVSKFIGSIDEDTFNNIRLLSAFLASFLYLFYKILNEKSYLSSIKLSIKKKETPVIHSLLCGFLFLGLPISLITLSQNSISSVVITLSQPTIPLFSMIFAHIFLKDEKISFLKLYFQLVALTGAILTLIPSINSNSNSKDFNLFHYLALFFSLVLFGIGSVYIKIFLSNSDTTLSCTLSIFGATLYSFLSSLYKIGLIKIFTNIFSINFSIFIKIIIIGIIYNCIPTFLFIYIVRTLGAVKANLTNFGQIVIGIISGVFFLNEWKNFNNLDIILSLLGIFLIIITIIIDFIDEIKIKPKTVQCNESSPNPDIVFETISETNE